MNIVIYYIRHIYLSCITTLKGNKKRKKKHTKKEIQAAWIRSVQAQLKHPCTFQRVSSLKAALQISYSWLTPKRCSVLLCAVAFQKDTMQPGSK